MSLEMWVYLVYLVDAFVAGALFGTHLASVRATRRELMAYQLKAQRDAFMEGLKASRPPRHRSDFPA